MLSVVEDGEFLYHEPCNKCGSSDARAVYSTGSSYCFSCNTYDKSGSQIEVKPTMPSDLIELGEAVALPKRNLHEQTCRKYDLVCRISSRKK